MTVTGIPTGEKYKVQRLASMPQKVATEKVKRGCFGVM